MGKTAQRKRSAFELGVEHAKKTGRGFLHPKARGPIAAAYTNGVKAGLASLTPAYCADYADGADYAPIVREDHVNMELWAWLKRVALLAALVFVALILFGCSTKTYTSPEGARITSTTVIYGPELTGLKAQDGNRTLEIEGQKTDIQQALTIIDKLTAPAKLGAAVTGVPVP